jgi:hypothetical protein
LSVEWWLPESGRVAGREGRERLITGHEVTVRNASSVLCCCTMGCPHITAYCIQKAGRKDFENFHSKEMIDI